MDIPPPDPADSATSPEEAPQPTSLVGWYRFALLLTGQPEKASAILETAFLALTERFARLRTRTVRRAWMVNRLRKEAAQLKATPPATTPAPLEADAPASPAPTPEQWARFAALPEPGRTAYALYLALGDDLLDQVELAELSGRRTPAALATALTAARNGLNPEETYPSDSLLPLFCPWREDPAAVTTASRATDEKNGAALEAQVRLDHEWRAALDTVSLPEGLELTLPVAPPRQNAFRHPAMLAVAVSMVVMIGAVFFVAKERMGEFPGKELVSGLVEESTEGGEKGLEAIEPMQLDRLADWFLLKGFDDFVAPEEFRGVVAEACRVFRHDGVAVAHAALVPRQADLFVFHSERLKPRVESTAWITFQQDDWAVATRSEGGLTYVITFLGDESDLPAFLKDPK